LWHFRLENLDTPNAVLAQNHHNLRSDNMLVPDAFVSKLTQNAPDSGRLDVQVAAYLSDTGALHQHPAGCFETLAVRQGDFADTVDDNTDGDRVDYPVFGQQRRLAVQAAGLTFGALNRRCPVFVRKVVSVIMLFLGSIPAAFCLPADADLVAL
jgi:hypothetical protein